MAPRECARGLIDIRAEPAAEIRIDSRKIVKSAADTPDNMIAEERREGHINGSAARDIEKIFRYERAARPQPANTAKYPVFHGLHRITALIQFRKIISLFLNAKPTAPY